MTEEERLESLRRAYERLPRCSASAIERMIRRFDKELGALGLDYAALDRTGQLKTQDVWNHCVTCLDLARPSQLQEARRMLRDITSSRAAPDYAFDSIEAYLATGAASFTALCRNLLPGKDEASYKKAFWTFREKSFLTAARDEFERLHHLETDPDGCRYRIRLYLEAAGHPLSALDENGQHSSAEMEELLHDAWKNCHRQLAQDHFQHVVHGSDERRMHLDAIKTHLDAIGGDFSDLDIARRYPPEEVARLLNPLDRDYLLNKYRAGPAQQRTSLSLN